MPKKKTHEEFIKELQEKHPENFNNIEILGEYKGIETKISCKCKKNMLIYQARFMS